VLSRLAVGRTTAPQTRGIKSVPQVAKDYVFAKCGRHCRTPRTYADLRAGHLKKANGLASATFGGLRTFPSIDAPHSPKTASSKKASVSASATDADRGAAISTRHPVHPPHFFCEWLVQQGDLPCERWKCPCIGLFFECVTRASVAESATEMAFLPMR